ncbi:MAG: sigma 54-interacting transcriptional regulator [Polyangiaceae bacterium]
MRKLTLQIDEQLAGRFEVPDGATVTVCRSEGGSKMPELVEIGPRRFELRIRNDALSATHAEIHFGEERASVRDLGSKNGSYLLLAPGAHHLCTERLRLGPGVMVELSDNPHAFPDELVARDAAELCSVVQETLGRAASAVRLVSTLPSAGERPRTVLPINGGKSLMVEWTDDTSDYAARSWLRAVVSRWNLRATTDEDGWTFTAASDARKMTLGLARRAAEFDVPIVLLGASGTGKGVLASNIHHQSRRSKAPFIEVNCSAIPDTLFESLMFGHAQGAFTSAHRSSTGVIDEADGGTLFLDEIGELPLPAQAKLLKFLDDGQYYPVGSSRPRRADVRIIAATNRDLANLIPNQFREDLFLRIATVSLSIPEPTSEDIRCSVPKLLADIAERHRITITPREVDELTVLAAGRRYPGHFRDLKSSLTRYLMYRDAERSLDTSWRIAVEGCAAPAPAMALTLEVQLLEEAHRRLPKLEKLLRLHLARQVSSVPELARLLGRTSAAVYLWLSKEGLAPTDVGNGEALQRAIDAEAPFLSGYRHLFEQLCRT